MGAGGEALHALHVDMHACSIDPFELGMLSPAVHPPPISSSLSSVFFFFSLFALIPRIITGFPVLDLIEPCFLPWRSPSKFLINETDSAFNLLLVFRSHHPLTSHLHKLISHDTHPHSTQTGAYYTGSTATHRLLTVSLSKHLDARVFAINYRLAPDTRFPGPIHDAVSAWFRLTEDLGVPPGNIILAGDSAGGGLCVAVMMYLRDQGYAMPGGAILMCPWVGEFWTLRFMEHIEFGNCVTNKKLTCDLYLLSDLTMSCASWDTNASLDVITFPTDPADHMNPIACYLGPEGMSKYITHPYASPLFGSFHGLPPMLIQSGDCEVLRDEVTLLAHKATLQGVDIVHEVYEDAVHVFQLYPFLEQGRKAFRSCRKFVLETLPALQARDKEREREKARMSRHASSADVTRSMEDGHLSMDVDAAQSTMATPIVRAPASPPLTPTRGSSTPLPPPTVNVSQSSPTSSSPSLSSSDDARFDDHVETALEREISGADGSVEPIVVDAYGGEEPRSRAASILSQVGHDDDDDGSGSDSGPATADEGEGANGTGDANQGYFANMPLPLPLPWRFTSSKSSSYIPTLKTFSPNSPSSSSTMPLSSSALKYSGPAPSESLSGSRTTPSSPTRSKSKSFMSSGAPSSPNASPPSSRTHALRNHRRTGSALGLTLTPVSRAPPVPEARRRSPTVSTFDLTSTRTSSSSSITASPTANVARPASSSHLSSSGSGPVPNYGRESMAGRARARTTSHPDMIKLMQEYAQRGPAQSTTTYAHTPVNASSGRRSRGTSMSTSAGGGVADHAPKAPASSR